MTLRRPPDASCKFAQPFTEKYSSEHFRAIQAAGQFRIILPRLAQAWPDSTWPNLAASEPISVSKFARSWLAGVPESHEPQRESFADTCSAHSQRSLCPAASPAEADLLSILRAFSARALATRHRLRAALDTRESGLEHIGRPNSATYPVGLAAHASPAGVAGIAGKTSAIASAESQTLQP